jgi:hypothetical protein
MEWISTCQAPLSEAAREGIALFNRGEFFAAHEALEHAWMQDATPGRALYQGILQVAVAYLLIERGNYAGTLKMFRRAQRWLEPLPGHCRGVDVETLRQDAYQVQQTILGLGKERLKDFNRSLFRPVEVH